MPEADDKPTGWRGSPELWVQAAYDALIEKGIDAVKVQPLAARLRLSRTSFYWFFRDRSALLDALSDQWERRTTAPLIAACRAHAGSGTEAMLNVIGTFLSDRTFDSRLEFAVRGWALQDDAMLGKVHAADKLRLEALRGLLERWGHGPQDADVRARTVYLVQIGYISMQTREDTETRLTRVPKYVEIFTGQHPGENEMARVRASLLGSS